MKYQVKSVQFRTQKTSPLPGIFPEVIKNEVTDVLLMDGEGKPSTVTLTGHWTLSDFAEGGTSVAAETALARIKALADLREWARGDTGSDGCCELARNTVRDILDKHGLWWS